MIDEIPIVTFDTSAHNRLAKDGPRSEAVLAAIKSEWFFRFAALSIEELVSTPDPGLRAAFFSSCAELQKGPNDCLYPQNELIRLLVVSHFSSPDIFDWRTVDVSAPEYEDALRSRSFVNDQQLATEQGQEMRTRKTDYKEMFCRPRQPIKEVFEQHKEAPPTTLREAITRLQGADSRLMWSMGKWLYDRGANIDASEAAVKHFMNLCPPFRALIYAMLMSWYNFGVRDPNTGQRFNAGANDQFMSIYLPYCDRFVTADEEQEKCLGEIAYLAGVKTEVFSYDKFVRDLLRL
jgi:hypothetical protein